MHSSILSDKKFLRTRCLAAREAIDTAQAEAAARAVVPHLLALIHAGAVVAGYRPIRNELDVTPALAALAARGHALCLPVIEHRHAPLAFHRWAPGEKLVKGSYAIDVPFEGEILVPDALIVPLAAFDAAGHRLGYGSGYYDETIARLRRDKPQLQVIGAAYAVQQVNEIPAEPHDQKLHAIVTEKGIIAVA